MPAFNLRSSAIVALVALALVGATLWLAYEPEPTPLVAGCLEGPSGMKAAFNEDSGRPASVEALNWAAYTSAQPRAWYDGQLAIVWFVAIEMRTPDGVSQVAIWATDEWPGDGALYAVDEPAIANSIYPVATDDGIVILPDDPDLLAVSGCLAAG